MTIRITVKEGQCSGKFHKVGDIFTVEQTTPGGMCMGAWNAIAPYVTTLCCGGSRATIGRWGSQPLIPAESRVPAGAGRTRARHEVCCAR